MGINIGLEQMIVIGIDPDSKEHGVALYNGGELMALYTWSLVEIMNFIKADKKNGRDILFSIEDVASQNFVYGRNVNSKSIQSNIAMKVGRCQQAQIELQRVLEHLGCRYELHKPQRGNWAKNKSQFEKATGWTKRSNEDTRSAAFFGFLAIK